MLWNTPALWQGALQFFYSLAPVGVTGEADKFIHGVVSVLIIQSAAFTEGLAPGQARPRQDVMPLEQPSGVHLHVPVGKLPVEVRDALRQRAVLVILLLSIGHRLVQGVAVGEVFAHLGNVARPRRQVILKDAPLGEVPAHAVNQGGHIVNLIDTFAVEYADAVAVAGAVAVAVSALLGWIDIDVKTAHGHLPSRCFPSLPACKG